MTSFWVIVETSRTRSTASKVAARSVPPWVIASSPISFSTSCEVRDGSPMTTRGGSPIRITLMASPRRESLTSCDGHGLGLVEPARPARGVTHAQRARRATSTRWTRRPAITTPNDSRNGLAIAETTSRMISVRIASSSHCSIRIRR